MHTKIDEIKIKIVERLQSLDPEKVILFGSYAWGNPGKDSDIDLYVVTKDDFLPHSFKENMEVRLKVANQLDDIMTHIPTDLIVHTRKMHEKFIQLNSYFSRKIMKDGIRLL